MSLQDEDQIVAEIQKIFSQLKKKKKTLKFDFGKKKKKVDVKEDLSKDYSYEELLQRVFDILKDKNQDLQERVYKIVPPIVQREGSKKTAFCNITDIATRMNRPTDHIILFVFAELGNHNLNLGTSGSLDGNQRLVIRGRFQQKQIETVLKKYIVEYVTCKICKSAETLLTKENRLYFVQCQSCGSTRSVSAIKTGFVAQIGRKKPTE